MPVVKTRLALKSEDIERIKQAIVNCGVSSEKVLNDYLHNEAGKDIAQSITKFLPRSNVNKVHAKDSKWWNQVSYNLAVGIENKTSGKNSFYYLYFPNTGTGTSKGKAQEFMETGLNAQYDNIVNDMIEKLLENINKELK